MSPGKLFQHWKERAFEAAIGASILGYIWLVWLWTNIRSVAPCPPNFRPSYDEIINYSDALSRHSGVVSSVPLYVFVAYNVFALASTILASRKRWVLIGLMLVFNLPVCLILFGLSLGCDRTILKHLQSVQFDEHVHHLTFGDDVSGGRDVYSQRLYLHECDLTGEACRGREIAGNLYPPYAPDYANARLMVDSSSNQLRISLGDELIFALDARTVPIPASFTDLEVITTDNAQQIEELLRLNYDGMLTSDWSPTGDTLIAAGSTGIWLYEFEGQEIVTHSLTFERTHEITLSGNGRLLASINSYDSLVRLWDVETETEMSLSVGSGDEIAFSPDGATLAIDTGYPRYVVLTDVETGSQIASFNAPSARSIVFSPDGNLLATAGYDHGDDDGRGYVRVWDLEAKEVLKSVRGYHLDSSGEVAFSPDGSLLAYPTREDRDPDVWVHDYETQVHLWDVETQVEYTTLNLPEESGNINTLAFSPDGSLLVTGGSDGIIHVWNVEEGAEIISLESNRGVDSIAFAPSGEMFASTDYRGTTLWGVR